MKHPQVRWEMDGPWEDMTCALIPVRPYGDGWSPMIKCAVEGGSCESSSGGSCCGGYAGHIQVDGRDFVYCQEVEIREKLGIDG